MDGKPVTATMLSEKASIEGKQHGTPSRNPDLWLHCPDQDEKIHHYQAQDEDF